MGIQAWAYGLRTTDSCTNGDEMITNALLNQGSVKFGDKIGYGVVGANDDYETVLNRLRGNCQRAQADQVLQFLCFGMAAVLAVMGFVQMRRGGLGKTGGGAGAYVA